MRTIKIQRNGPARRRKRKATTKRRASSTVARRRVTRRPTRRRTTRSVAASPRRVTRRRVTRRRSTGLAAPRRRVVRRSQPVSMVELLGAGAVGAVAGIGLDMGLDRLSFLNEKIEKDTTRAIVKTGITGAVCALMLAATKKKKVKTRKMARSAAVGALAISIARTGKILYDEHVAKSLPAPVVDGDDGALEAPRRGNVVGLRAPQRGHLAAPQRGSLAYPTGVPVAGRVGQLYPNSVEGQDYWGGGLAF